MVRPNDRFPIAIYFYTTAPELTFLSNKLFLVSKQMEISL